MATTPERTPERSVPTRRISFTEALSEVPRHFAGDGDLIVSHLMAALSSVFPEGEDSFVRSVRHYRPQITDPTLKQQVNGFIGQEATHGREHRALNDRLAELGYPTKRMERIARRTIATRERFASPEMNLATTAALEHFTATLAESALGDEEVRRLSGDTVLADLFLWHALEESEHKAVAFDVYRAVGGREKVRVRAMNIVTVGFLTATTVQVVASLLGDRRTYRRGELRRSFRRFRASPWMSPDMWRRLREYNRAGFHPDDRDTTELVAHWREELFGEHGTLRDRLADGTAA